MFYVFKIWETIYITDKYCILKHYDIWLEIVILKKSVSWSLVACLKFEHYIYFYTYLRRGSKASKDSAISKFRLNTKVSRHRTLPLINHSINPKHFFSNKQCSVPGHFPRQIVWREAWAARRCASPPGPDDPNSSQSSSSDRAPAHTVASAPAGRTGQRPWTRVGNKKTTQKTKKKSTKKTTKMFFGFFSKFWIFYENNTNFSLWNRFFINK